MKRAVIGMAVGLLASAPAYPATLQADEARNHIGEFDVVCGTVAAVQTAPQLRDDPVFLRLGHPYPHQDFTVVIPSAVRVGMTAPEAMVGRQICVSGYIQLFRGKPQVVPNQASELTGTTMVVGQRPE